MAHHTDTHQTTRSFYGHSSPSITPHHPYQRIREACNADGYPEPEWQELGAAVRIVFRPHPETGNETDEPANEPANDTVNKRQKWFLEQLGSGKKINSADIVEQCHVAPATAKRDIAELKHLGMIEFVGLQLSNRKQLE